MTPNRCVVNCADNKGYFYGHDRLVKSIGRVWWPRPATLFWRGDLPHGSPSHHASPYRLKPKAILHARDAGFNVVLWADAMCWAMRKLDTVFEAIERDGILLTEMPGGVKLGQYAADAFLEYAGMTRDEAMTIPLVATGLIGFDLRRPEINAVLDAWDAAGEAGHFAHAQVNEINEHMMYGRSGRGVGKISDDPRCLGHSGDEPAITVLAHRAGLPNTPWGHTLATCSGAWWQKARFESEAPPTVVFLHRGIDRPDPED